MKETKVMNGKTYRVVDNEKAKIVKSDNYNLLFRKTDGFMARWGKTEKDDPDMAPAPEILDIETTTTCYGVPCAEKDENGVIIPGKMGKRSPCRFCYKSNGPVGKNMSFETFKNVLDKVSASGLLTQIAIGADSEAVSNGEDLWKMMEYTRNKGIVPNITVANISNETADKLVKFCGAVAVSRYENKDVCYDSVERLTSRGLSQCNIHVLVSEETFDWIMETLNDRLTDPRLANMRAIVLLSLKRRGRGKGFTPLSAKKFKQIVDFAFENNISVGFDSCSCVRVLKAIEDHPSFDMILQQSEPCESSCFSSFCDVDGVFFPCSFTQGYGGWEEGISVVDCQDFVKDIWNNPKVKEFRKNLLATKDKNKFSCRTCPLFEIEKESI